MLRYLMVERGVYWDQFKNSSAHYVKQYVSDLERAKRNFKGLSKGDSKKFSLASSAAGIATS